VRDSKQLSQGTGFQVETAARMAKVGSLLQLKSVRNERWSARLGAGAEGYAIVSRTKDTYQNPIFKKEEMSWTMQDKAHY
jgi:hypothetical protein